MKMSELDVFRLLKHQVNASRVSVEYQLFTKPVIIAISYLKPREIVHNKYFKVVLSLFLTREPWV